MNVDMSDL